MRTHIQKNCHYQEIFFFFFFFKWVAGLRKLRAMTQTWVTKTSLSDCLHVKSIKIKQCLTGLPKTRSQNLVRKRVLILKKIEHMRKNDEVFAQLLWLWFTYLFTVKIVQYILEERKYGKDKDRLNVKRVQARFDMHCKTGGED